MAFREIMTNLCSIPAMGGSKQIREVVYKIDINTLERKMEDKELNMNDISKVKICTTKPLMIDPYRENRTTGSKPKKTVTSGCAGLLANTS